MMLAMVFTRISCSHFAAILINGKLTTKFLSRSKSCVMAFVCCILIQAVAVTANGQLMVTSPTFIQESSSSVEITGDANFGNQGLLNHSPVTDVYVHIGVITNYSTGPANWLHVPAASVWGSTNSAIQCTSVGTNKWKYTITGGLRNFFGLTDPNEKILKIAMLFRSGNGSKKLANTGEGDMYIPVYTNSTQVRIDNPFRKADYNNTPEPVTKNVGDNVSIIANASPSSNLTLFFNGTQVATAAAATQITASPVIAAPGTQTLIAEAVNGATTVRDTINFLVTGAVNVAALPAGVRDGINYETDATTATLVLYAPNKTRVAVLGDFNNWTETIAHQMNRTPDGNRYWLRLTGLTAGMDYGYQYIIDGSLKVADAYTEKVLDPANDQFISSSTYPSLKAYPTGKTTGIVSILQTQKPAFNWTATSYTKPVKTNLVVYELLLRDFVTNHNWQTLRDSLNYLQKLGINAIELMPFNEFEGNNSWGYNTSFYFAPDKYYGTETALKQFIDECHNRGIAVLMDIAMNHSFGQSPMVQMYWDAANNRPAANSPWFNTVAKHPYNVGYDFNHESQATKDLVDRVTEHWLTNYKIDGFRWDLSKGFTQTNSCTTGNCDQGSEVNNWGNYDAGRIALWKRIYDKMQSQATGSYCILEHFAANNEEIELSNYGMLLWGNSNHNFNEATMGWTSTSNFEYGIYKNRGWTVPNLITYQESHDEERLMYKNTQFGNSSAAPAYDVKTLSTGLKRNEMAAAFWAMIPGPKMLWQFGELGYDFSINRCEDGSINNNCRTNPKPIRWDYVQDANRQALYQVYSKLIKLHTSSSYTSTFTSNNITWGLNGGFKWMSINEPSLRVMVLGNFDVTTQIATVTFPVAGTWYSYLTGTTRTATSTAESITLQPGEYYVYTDRNAAGTVLSLPSNTVVAASKDSAGYADGFKINIGPNPVKGATNINYSLLQNGDLYMGLTDISGKNIAVFYSGYKQKGSYTISTSNKIDLKKMPVGMYVLQVQFNGIRRSIKLINSN